MQKCFGTPDQILRFVELQKRESQFLKYSFINLIDFLCIKSACPALIDNTPVYADGNHLSLDFSRKFSAVIRSLRLYG
jgi:hypothetical protein